MALGVGLWAKAYDLKRKGMSNKKIKLALRNKITERSILMVWQKSRERLQPLYLGGEFDPKEDWPTAEAILEKHPHFFCTDKKKEQLAQIASNTRLEKEHVRKSKHAIKIDKKNRQQQEGLPFADLYPVVGVRDADCCPGDFQQPDLQPGELRTLELKGTGHDSILGEFHSGVAEIGIPNPDAWLELGEKLPHLEHFAQDLAHFVGPGQKRWRLGYKDPIPTAICKGWRVARDVKNPSSDITYFYPSTRDKLDELLKTLEGIGLGQILKNIPKFLEIPRKEGELPALTFTEINLIAVSCNGDWETYFHDDMNGKLKTATLLVPLLLPKCRDPELRLQAEHAKHPTLLRPPKVELEKLGFIKNYRYCQAAALLFKAGVEHNTNILLHSREPRLMLCIHLGAYTELECEELQKKCFNMPAARKVIIPHVKGTPRQNAKTSELAVMQWQEDYKIQIDEEGKMDWPAKKK